MKSTVERILAKSPVDKVFFVACGGSIGAFYPAKFLIEKEGKKIQAAYVSANEFVHTLPASLGESSLVVVCSHQGDTPETVEGAKVAKAAGARVVAFSYNPEAALFAHADETIVYSYPPNVIYTQKKEALGLRLVMELLHQQEGWGKYDAAMQGFDRYDTLVHNALAQVRDAAKDFAAKNAQENVIYTVGSGSCWGSAYMECICILMEMQWIHSSCIHSGEFFHGPLEITDTETPFLVLVNEGSTRPLDERVVSFLQKYGRKVYVVDAKDLGINVIDSEVTEYFAPLLLTHVLDVYNEALADARKHPLMTRRYMWKVAY